MGKKWIPEITDRLNKNAEREITNWWSEWEKPSEDFCSLWNWYQINTNWIVSGQNGEPMIYIFRKWKRSPFVIISIRKNKEWEIKPHNQEIRIDKLMIQYFWTYIKWYWEKNNTRNKDKDFIVVPPKLRSKQYESR